MKTFKAFIVFLVINFGALALGSWLMNSGPQTTWYQNLDKAPWTPPGWVFGVAWTIIMLCFSAFMAYLYTLQNTLLVKLLFAFQVLLNVSWNYIFFNRHMLLLSIIVISLLTILIFYILIHFRKILKSKSLFIVPYVIWLCLATSLNLYVFLNN